MKTWITGDTHFGHANIIKYCDRPFASVEDMNGELLRRWKATVAAEDMVYFMGDFCFTNKVRADWLFNELPGHKHLFVGNHDPISVTKKLPWVSVRDYAEIRVDDTWLVLHHYPIEDWNGKKHGAVHLHGHSHGTARSLPNRYDVGVDCTDFRPILLSNAIRLAKEVPK